jgi:hypothetical protein
MNEFHASTPDHFSLEAERMPRSVDIDLSETVMEWLIDASSKTGRSKEELILELICKGLNRN